MSRLLALFITFLKIGVFGFGGGYAMIGMIQADVVSCNKWLSAREFTDIIAIAEMTPGPIAVNSATFVGYRLGGVWGALISTVGVVLVSFCLVLLLSECVDRLGDSRLMKTILLSLRPTIVALVAVAAAKIGKTAFTGMGDVFLCIVAFGLLVKTRIHPIMLIILSGIAGCIMYGHWV